MIVRISGGLNILKPIISPHLEKYGFRRDQNGVPQNGIQKNRTFHILAYFGPPGGHRGSPEVRGTGGIRSHLVPSVFVGIPIFARFGMDLFTDAQ